MDLNSLYNSLDCYGRGAYSGLCTVKSPSALRHLHEVFDVFLVHFCVLAAFAIGVCLNLLLLLHHNLS